MDQTDGTTRIDAAGTGPRQPKGIARTIVIIAIVLLVAAFIAAVGYGLVSHPQLTAAIRDVSIIVLALVTVVIGLFLAILIYQVQSLMVLLRDEIKPILESANDTASTVRGTTAFVSNAVVTPVIEAASFVAAVRRTVGALTKGADRRGLSEKGPKGA